jgi:hypothetical protein
VEGIPHVSVQNAHLQAKKAQVIATVIAFGQIINAFLKIPLLGPLKLL